MTRQRSTTDKVGDWFAAYQAISAEVTPDVLRKMLGVLTSGIGDTTTPAEAIAVLTQSMNLARLIAANDRMAAVAAAMLTASGVSRPVVVDGEDPA